MARGLIWLLFGNDDDGIYGDLNWNPTQAKSTWIAIQWWFRNPLHNLVFYVMGAGHTERTRTGGGAQSHRD